MFEEIFNKFNVSDRTKELTKVPPKLKKKDFGKIQSFKKNVSQQADLLMLPNDNGFRYLLTVVDIYDRTIDAEPLRSKTANEVLNAFKKIYSRKNLDIPKLISFDSGSEFKGDVKKYFENKNVAIKYTKPGRHTQQAVIESVNRIIGKLIMSILTNKDLENKQNNTEWTQYIRQIVNTYNKHKKKPEDDKDTKPICNEKRCELIPEGTKVRYALDYPINARGQRQHGEFRSGDIRWSTTTHKIDKIIMTSNQPPLYKLDGVDRVLYKRKQLMIV